MNELSIYSNKTCVNTKNKKNNEPKKYQRQLFRLKDNVLQVHKECTTSDDINEKNMNLSKEIKNKSEKLANFIEFTLKHSSLQKPYKR